MAGCRLGGGGECSSWRWRAAGNGAGSKPNRRGKRGRGAAVAAGAAVAPRSSNTPPSSSRSSGQGAASPSASLQGAGPPSTTPGRAPSSCGRVPAILLWRSYLDRRSSNRRSSHNSSICPNHNNCFSRSCSRTSNLLLHLVPLRSANGVRSTPITPWPTSLSGIHSRSPPRSARQH
jgi:hypothetical protein